VVGCDLDRGHLRKNPSLAAALAADGERLPFADGVFDLVSANMVLEHLGNPSAVFREVGRVLAPGGAFIFVTPNRRHPAVFLMSAVLSPELRRRVAHWADPTQQPEHIFTTFYRANTASAIVRLSRNVGFLPVRLEPFSSLPMYHGASLGQLVEAAWIRLTRTRPFRSFSSNLIGLLRKPVLGLYSA
jgi:SAM-dependent methyltransferase